MWTVESEVNEALTDLNLSQDDLIKCASLESINIQKRAMDIYVHGNPRSWWMGLTKPHIAYDYDFPSDHIVELMPNKDQRVWWIPETEKESLCVYDIKPESISAIMEKTAQFEYYVLGKDFSWLIIETDHSELWLVEK